MLLQAQPHVQLPRLLAALVGDELEQLELPLSVPPGRLPASAVPRHAAGVSRDGIVDCYSPFLQRFDQVIRKADPASRGRGTPIAMPENRHTVHR